MVRAVNSDDETRSARSRKSLWLGQARQLHLYLGTFFAPSIIFFALTGALQLFGLHESRPGETYQAPAWIAKLGSVHKHQNLGERRGPPPGAEDHTTRPTNDQARGMPLPQDRRRGEKRQDGRLTLALKWFFLATSIGLILTTLLGIYMAFQYNRSRILIWVLLSGGAVIPAGLVALME